MFSREFWLGDNGAIARAVRTAAQTAIALLGASQFSLFSIDLKNVFGVSAASALMSVLMSLDRGSLTPSKGPVGVAEPVAVEAQQAETAPVAFVSQSQPVVHGHGGSLR